MRPSDVGYDGISNAKDLKSPFTDDDNKKEMEIGSRAKRCRYGRRNTENETILSASLGKKLFLNL